jgi:hypothetical protein
MLCLVYHSDVSLVSCQSVMCDVIFLLTIVHFVTYHIVQCEAGKHCINEDCKKLILTVLLFEYEI